MREKLLELKIDTTQVLRDNFDAVYLTEHDADQILALISEEIRGRNLPEAEVERLMRADPNVIIGAQSVAQAQLRGDSFPASF